MKFWHIILAASVILGLAGCAGETPEPTTETKAATINIRIDESEEYASTALQTAYEGALPASNQLALGTLLLEETEKAVTPQQAKALLPLWQAIQGGGLQNNTEINAVFKQIEGKMTPEQLAAMAAMQLTAQDLQTWAQEQGMGGMFSPEAVVTRQAQGDGQGGFGQFGDMSEEEREAMRATMQAGGLPPGGPGNLSEEEREAMRATAEAGGQPFGNRGFNRGGTGQVGFLAQPLIALLTQRAAE